MYKNYLKIFFDISFSVLLVILLFPIMLIISLIIKYESKGPIFFKQKRLGKNGKIFNIFKFRTMIVDAESQGTGLFTDGNDPRITKVGFFLRKYSLDELPQLFNILIGDMSFVGPRPPVPYHPYKFDQYPVRFKVRFEYRPGITGYAQINGRTNLTWIQRLEYDVDYHLKFSFLFDISILLKTIWKIIKRENIYPEDINIGKSHRK